MPTRRRSRAHAHAPRGGCVMADRTVAGSMLLGCIAVVASSVTACTGARPATPAATTRPAAASAEPARSRNDYGRPDAWLCRPGRQDACAVDLTATSITADGKLLREDWRSNPDAAIDCFYVYPTVSRDPSPNSDMQPGPEERRAVELQLARFGSECRLFAPMYRQVTLAGLRQAIQAGRLPDWRLACG